MATHALPSSHILDEDGAPAAAHAPARVSLLRRLYIAILVSQMRRAQREIDRKLGPRRAATRIAHRDSAAALISSSRRLGGVLPTRLQAKTFLQATFPTTTQEQEDYPMLPTVIYLIEAIRRALKKSGRGVFMLVDVFGEAMEDWRKAKRKYPFAE